MKKNNFKISIVVSDFYPELSDLLFENCFNQLIKNGINKESISIHKVAGAFEIPGVVSQIAKHSLPDAIITLGVIIKGETPHFDFISSTSTQAIMRLSIDSKKPIGNGIITCLNMRQARARGKKGKEAALAVISVLSQ